MNVDVLLFGKLAELAQPEFPAVELAAGARVADAVAAVVREHPELEPLLDSVAYAVNTEYRDRAHVLSDGDELALIPPVSGV